MYEHVNNCIAKIEKNKYETGKEPKKISIIKKNKILPSVWHKGQQG